MWDSIVSGWMPFNREEFAVGERGFICGEICFLYAQTVAPGSRARRLQPTADIVSPPGNLIGSFLFIPFEMDFAGFLFSLQRAQPFFQSFRAVSRQLIEIIDMKVDHERHCLLGSRSMIWRWWYDSSNRRLQDFLRWSGCRGFCHLVKVSLC